jgi:radical SAM superfamily enzyme YgiQ (UPF0313 family)
MALESNATLAADSPQPSPQPSEAWRTPGAVLLVSCYELGRQPFNIASPWAQLEQAGFGVAALDTAIEALDDARVRGAQLIAISVPMHTALRLARELAPRLRALAPNAHLCFFGLYASLNAELLLGEADSVIGGEFEVALTELARALAHSDGQLARDAAVQGVVLRRDQLSADHRKAAAPPVLRKLPFVVPKRSGLAPPERYATFLGPTPDEVRQVGYVEASRGCLHACRHCPVTPVYQRRFFVVPREVVLADADQQIARGASHITFGDPDFLNGPKHAMAVARELHRRHPNVSFDVTVKVEHILEHPEYMAELPGLGCAFVVSAVESLNDRVLAELDKGHTRADVFEALRICREAGVAMRPSLVAFTPWTTLDDYVELVDWIAGDGLVDHIDPIQLAIRLLIPPGSALLWEPAERPWLGELVSEELGYRWSHTDARVDALHAEVSAIVERGAGGDGEAPDHARVLHAIRVAAYQAAGKPAPSAIDPGERVFVPRLSEAWFCCAEPTARQFAQLDKKGDTGRCCD